MIASYIYDDRDQLVSVSRGGPVLRSNAATEGKQNYYYHFNGHGDVTKITNSSGQVVASYEYDAWGNITSLSGGLADIQPFRYAGYLYDPETGLYYLINRYYDPSMGRFISKDPQFSSLPDSLGANSYLYVRNNPVNRTDPDGLGPTGTLCGRVMNTAGSPIVGAVVRYGNIAISGGNYILSGNANVMPTNGAGEYRFTLETGIYNLYFDAVGYISQVQQYHAVWPGQETVAPTVTMSPAVYAPAPAPQPSSGSTTQPAPSSSQPAPLSLCQDWFFSASPLGKDYRIPRIDAKHIEIGRKFIKMIPEKASVVAQTDLVPHLSQRREIKMFPSEAEHQYILLDHKVINKWPLDEIRYAEELRKLLQDPKWGVIAYRDGFILFKRGFSTKKNKLVKKKLL